MVFLQHFDQESIVWSAALQEAGDRKAWQSQPSKDRIPRVKGLGLFVVTSLGSLRY